VIGENVPYGMIQPLLDNRFEYKVVLVDGIAIGSKSKSPKGSHAFCKSHIEKREILYPFAESCLKRLKMARPGTIDKGLVRVDIMQDNSGKMIVNEFESFEAGYATNEKSDTLVHNCLIKFWEQTLARLYEEAKKKF
jgi:hypothetical protein